jgi:hypothetical protein
MRCEVSELLVMAAGRWRVCSGPTRGEWTVERGSKTRN